MSLLAKRGNPKPLRLLSLRDATRTFHFVAFAMTYRRKGFAELDMTYLSISIVPLHTKHYGRTGFFLIIKYIR
ncbi:hypothetical protein [Nostoc sp. UHCC 0252]|uniref:hypothetical protein n=1 Tax=Nostoc sp. UHCC 0252 TaxID=3110241 RepID=UPI002B20707A|nr:hypothetical protein [Nostoc sp. UHCC 0252]MEA5601144.1 hypothetical protein [Nostoc sp. UHCC 0252]